MEVNTENDINGGRKMYPKNEKVKEKYLNRKTKIITLLVAILLITSIAVWATVQNIGKRSISEKNPFFGTTMDYYVPLANFPVKVTSCYDDTYFHIDYDGDGIWDVEHTIEIYGTTVAVNNLPASARIQGTKPLIVWMGDNDWYATIPTASELGTQYLVPCSGTLYVTPIYSATYVQVDTDGNGAYDVEQYVAPGHPLQLSVSGGALINSNKPVMAYHYSEHSFLTETDDVFYFPFEDKSYTVTALEDFTQVSIDTNLDGVADEQYTLDARESLTFSGYFSGTKIYSDKPITVFCHEGYGFPLIPGNKLGTDFFLRAGAYVVAVYSNTTIYFDTDNNGIYEDNCELLITQPQTYTSFHIHTDKPVAAYFLGTTYGDVCPAATLGTTMDVTPNEIGLNENVEEHITIANPTETNVTNITLAAYIPDSFSVNNPLTVNIEKKSLYTDTIIASDSITINLTQSSGYYEIAMSKYNTSLFNELDDHHYLYITFNATSPSTEAVYTFKEIEVTYDATTWVD